MAIARIRGLRFGIAFGVAAVWMGGVALAQPTQPGLPDTPGGIASTRLVVRLRADAFARSAIRRAAAVADNDALPRTSVRFRALASAWRASKMRRGYRDAFSHPAIAEKYGLDRTFVLEVPAGTDTQRLANALSALNDEVEFAAPDVIGSVASDPIIPSDQFFNIQWGMNNTGQSINGGPPGLIDADIDAPEAWAIHTGVGPNLVIVAVIDSGISSHPEFGNNLGPLSTGRILPGWNTVLNSGTAANLQDSCPHGTHVAGIVGAAGGTSCGGGTSDLGKSCQSAADCAPGCVGSSNAGQPCVTSNECPGGVCGDPTCTAIGVAGMSWGVYLLPVKVLTGCSGNATDLSEGIVWAADHGADIINMSVQYNLSQQTSITTMQAAVNYAHDAGVLLVAATGNNDNCSNGVPPANDTVCYPARMTNVMAVTATDNQDGLGFFANYGVQTDVAAPGQNIYSTWTNGQYHDNLGTSMATPHVSGLAALIKSYVPELTNDEIEEIIETTAEDRGAPGWDDHFGYGRINAHLALLAAAQWPGILESNPPDTAIDARQPIDRKSLAPVGWSSIDLRFPRDVDGVASSDFSIEQSVAGSAPSIIAVEPLDTDHVRITLDRPIDPQSWTTITHVATGSRVRLGYLPGDAGSDGLTSPADILELIDSLNGVFVRPIWATDIDRSGVAAPPDIITLIDLLNGAAPFAVYNGKSLPPMP